MKRVDICPERTRFKRVVHLEGRRESKTGPPLAPRRPQNMNSPTEESIRLHHPQQFPRGGNKQDPVRQTGARSRESNIPTTPLLRAMPATHLPERLPPPPHDRLRITNQPTPFSRTHPSQSSRFYPRLEDEGSQTQDTGEGAAREDGSAAGTGSLDGHAGLGGGRGRAGDGADGLGRGGGGGRGLGGDGAVVVAGGARAAKQNMSAISLPLFRSKRQGRKEQRTRCGR